MAFVEDLMAKLLRPPRVLLVEDDSTVGGAFLNHIREDYEVDIDWAVDGEQAVNFLKRKSYDIVFLDLVLPRKNGVEVLRHIKATKPSLPVIVVTGAVGSPLWHEATSLGVVGVISKPFTKLNIEDVFRTYGIRALSKREARPYGNPQPLPA
jgi:CheY-like chemotaxis protein